MILLEKKYIILILIIILLIVFCFNSNLFSSLGLDNGEITLTQASTYGYHNIYRNGSENTNYYIGGVFKGLPDDAENYTLETIIYDENGKLIDKTVYEYFWMSMIIDYSKDSEFSEVGCVSIEGFKNVTLLELKLLNPNGTIMFDQNYTFAMENISVYDEIEDYKFLDDIKIVDFESWAEIYTYEDSKSNCNVLSGATLKNYPSYMEEGFTVKVIYFDENHKKIGEVEENLQDVIFDNEENGDVILDMVGEYVTSENNMPKYAVMSILYDDVEVTNSSCELDKNAISYIDKNVDDSDSSTDSDKSTDLDSSNNQDNSNKVTPHFRKFTDEENKQFEYYYDKYLADNG